MRFCLFLTAFLMICPTPLRAQSISLAQRDAVVWGREQTVRGTLDGAASGVLHAGDEAIPFTASDGAFAVSVVLGEGTTAFVACTADGSVCSDTLRLTLGYRLRPEVDVSAEVAGRTATLRGRVLDNPGDAPLTFAWTAEADNPAALSVMVVSDTTAQIDFPMDAPDGDYIFALTATPDGGAAFTARVLVAVRGGLIAAPSPAAYVPAWADRAVLYEIAPRYFAGQFNGKLRYVTDKIPELVRLGITTIWLQPIFPSHDGGQGYDVLDYFGVWGALGTKNDLRTLVETAHAAGLRVMLDFVPNHTSIHHPYAQDAIAHGAASHYFDFYQRTYDDAPYSNNYHTRTDGEMTFVYYFWTDLVNLNFDNPEVQRHIIEATRYWVEEFDIDGYRLDAVWAVVARNPEFVQRWRLALKRVKPDLFLLGETKATDESSYDERFDAAYDWTADPGYISEWAWQRASQDRTIFNQGLDRFRSRDLRSALTDFGRGYAPGARILRYLENNDTPRFTANHSAAQTRMAATLLFSLPNIPMMYYGQEVGISTQFPSFSVNATIESYDYAGFFPFYQHLLRLRDQFASLHADADYSEVAVTPSDVAGQTFAFLRGSDGVPVVAVANMGASDVAATLALPTDTLGLADDAVYFLTDLFTGDASETTGSGLRALSVSVPAHTTRLFALADAPVSIPTDLSGPEAIPAERVLARAFPNPFSGAVTFSLVLGQPRTVTLRVFDVLGREVARPLDGVPHAAGEHAVRFDAGDLPSGVYLYRLDAGSAYRTGQIVQVR